MCPTNPLVNVQIFLRVQFCSFLERLGSHGFLLELSGRNSRPHDVYSVRNEGWGGGMGGLGPGRGKVGNCRTESAYLFGYIAEF